MSLYAVDWSWATQVSLPEWTQLAAVVTGSLVGAQFAAKRGFDPIGVFSLAFAQGLGGLLLLELLLLNGTPQFLANPVFLIGTTVASIAGFFFSGLLTRMSKLLFALDALSMGFLVCIGVQSALELQLPLVSGIFLGTLAATGGVVLRDVLAGVSPTLLQPGVLSGACALAGAVLYSLLWKYTEWPRGIEQLITVAVVFALRIASTVFGWRTTESRDLSTAVIAGTDSVWDRVTRSRSRVGGSGDTEAGEK